MEWGNKLKNKMKVLSGHKLFLSFLLNAVLLVLFLLFTNVMYETNDDYAISRLIAVYGETSIPYMNALLTAMLCGLQKIVPFCNLFVLYQIAGGYLSFSAITYVFLDKFHWRFSLPVSLAVVTLFGYNHYALIQFTKTAYLLAIAGFLLLIHAFYKKKTVWMCAAGGLFVLFGCFTRTNSFFVAAAFTGVFLLAFFFIWIIRKKGENTGVSTGTALIALLRSRRKYLIAWALIFAAGLAAIFTSAQIYSLEEGYDEYARFNKVRAQTLDYPMPSYTKNQEFYTQLGLNQNDLSMYRGWYIDTNVFTTEKLEKISALQKEQKLSIISFYSEEIKNFFTELSSELSMPVETTVNLYLLICLALLFLAVFLLKKFPLLFIVLCSALSVKAYFENIKEYRGLFYFTVLLIAASFYLALLKRKMAVMPLALSGLSLALVMHLCYIQRINHRAAYGIFLCAIILLVYSVEKSELRVKVRQAGKGWRRWAAVMACAGVIVCGVLMYHGLSTRQMHYPVKQGLMQYLEQNQDKLYLRNALSGNINTYHMEHPLEPFNSYECENLVSLGSWLSGSNFEKNQLKAYGITNLYQDMIDNPKVFVLDRTGNMQKQEAYLNRHYNRSDNTKIIFRQVKTIDGIRVYQAVTVAK